MVYYYKNQQIIDFSREYSVAQTQTKFVLAYAQLLHLFPYIQDLTKILIWHPAALSAFKKVDCFHLHSRRFIVFICIQEGLLFS